MKILPFNWISKRSWNSERSVWLYLLYCYCWDIHTVWRSFPNDTVAMLPLEAQYHCIVLYCYAFYTSHSWACFSNQFISFHPAPSSVCAHTNAISSIRCGQSILAVVFTQHMFTVAFSWSTNTKHMLVCADGLPLTRFMLFLLWFLYASLSVVHAIMRQAPTID